MSYKKNPNFPDITDTIVMVPSSLKSSTHSSNLPSSASDTLLVLKEWIRRCFIYKIDQSIRNMFLESHESWNPPSKRDETEDRSLSSKSEDARHAQWEREIKKIYERFIISLFNEKKFRDEFAFTPMCKVHIDKWMMELRERNLGPDINSPHGREMRNYVVQYLEYLQSYITKMPQETLVSLKFESRVLTVDVSCNSKPDLTDLLSCGEWPSDYPEFPKSKVGCTMTIQVLAHGNQLSISKSSHFPDKESKKLAKMAIVAIRYDAMFSQGQQWGVPKRVRAALRDEFGINYEAFASPFNFDWSNKRYGSLFPDCDPESLGPFPESALKLLPSEKDPDREKKWLVNPPFIESVMINALDAIKRELKTGDSKNSFFIILPEWKDSRAHIDASASPFCQFAINLEPGTFYFEEPNGKFVRGSFPCTAFFLSLSPVPSNELTKKVNTVMDAWSEKIRNR